MLDHLRIGPFTVSVQVANLPDDHGRWDGSSHAITISDKAEGLNAWATLLHEALHAISDFYGMDLEEPKVRTLEVALVQLLRDNPELTKHIARAK